jgi:uncharacterized protein YndB with AHSA1/START domain
VCYTAGGESKVAQLVRSREGYLVIADIAGYTAFLTGTELEHAQSIIEELTALIRERLAPPLRFVKLEGDAVFCYADVSTFADGERLVEVLEACYFDFSNLLFNMVRATTCRCAACASIDSLDLKFIAHYGTFVVQHGDAGEDLAGADVILVHRLLKNAISEQLGCRAYVFFTDACLQHVPAAFALPKHFETYESFGETSGGVHDLQPVLREMREARREHVSAADADLEMNFVVPVPPPVAWQYFVDPVQRLRWACGLFDKDPDKAEPNARGRSGVGAKSHCNHGPGVATREVIDWRPFSYVTCRTMTPFAGGFITARPVIETTEFVPHEDGSTSVYYRLRVVDRGRLSMLALRATPRLFFRTGARNWNTKLQAALQQDIAAASSQ